MATITTADLTFTCLIDKSSSLSITAVEHHIGGQKYLGAVSEEQYQGKKVISKPEVLLQMLQDGLANKNGSVTVTYQFEESNLVLHTKFEVPYLSEQISITLTPTIKSQAELVTELSQSVQQLIDQKQQLLTTIEQQHTTIGLLLKRNFQEFNRALRAKEYELVESLIDGGCGYNTTTIQLMLEHGTYQLYQHWVANGLSLLDVRSMINDVSGGWLYETPAVMNLYTDPEWFAAVFKIVRIRSDVVEAVYKMLIKGHHLETIKALHVEVGWHHPRTESVVGNPGTPSWRYEGSQIIDDLDLLHLLCALKEPFLVTNRVTAMLTRPAVDSYIYQGGYMSRVGNNSYWYAPK